MSISGHLVDPLLTSHSAHFSTSAHSRWHVRWLTRKRANAHTLATRTGAVLLVYANKQDSPDALSAAEISERLGLAKLKGRSFHIQACCALTGEVLYPGMEWITAQLKHS